MTETTTTRSAERLEFLRDIIIGAVEGGINDWAQVSQYQYVDHDKECICVGRRLSDAGTRATIHQINDDATGYEEEALEVDVEVIARGLGRLKRGEVHMNPDMLAAILEADEENDAGQIDAYDASCIVQAGLFSELVFG